MSAGASAETAQRQKVVLEGGDGTTLERLAGIGTDRPDLAHLLPFWIDIYRAQLDARQELLASEGPLSWEVRHERLEDGRPQLDATDLPLDKALLGRTVERLEEAWRQHDQARERVGMRYWSVQVRRAFADPTCAPGQRRYLGFEEMLSALCLVPYLEWAAETIAPLLQGELERWGRERCPVCGGYPDLAALAGDPGARYLICSRCSSAWDYRRVGCPFCQDVERQVYHAGGEEPYRLYLCEACRRYLKTVDTRPTGGRLDPRVERLVTIGMDLAALEAGYGPNE